MSRHPGLFKKRYDSLSGKDWLKGVSPEDRSAFGKLGFMALAAKVGYAVALKIIGGGNRRTQAGSGPVRVHKCIER